ncbi:MAG: substrate-binding domain-containing protein [Pirellulales bacterium]
MTHRALTWGVLCCFAALSGCGAENGSAKKTTIAVVPKGTTHQFWQSVRYGAEQAAKELDVALLWKGPSKEDDRLEQVNVVETFITRGVDGVCLAPLDAPRPARRRRGSRPRENPDRDLRQRIGKARAGGLVRGDRQL